MNLPAPGAVARRLPDIHRRRVVRLAACLPAMLCLPACGPASGTSATAGGGPSYLLPIERLEALVSQRFPATHRVQGLLALTLRHPRLTLRPAHNRIGTHIDLEVAEQLTGTRYPGALALDYGLHFDPAEAAIRMRDVRVERVAFDGVPPAYQAAFAQLAPRVAERLLDGLVLYRLPDGPRALAQGLGLTVKGFEVVPEGLRVRLGRATPSAAQ